MRSARIVRNTKETGIELYCNLDGTGEAKLSTKIGFLDHMLTLFAAHSGMDLELKCEGDIWIDYHHSVEDIGIVLGSAVSKALGDKKGIYRYGSMILPMDEVLMQSAVDVSGRSMLVYDANIPAQKIGDFDTELVKEFWLAFVRHSGLTLHIRMLNGENSHHIAEAMFKSVARSIKAAIKIDPENAGKIPSTKGVLE